MRQSNLAQKSAVIVLALLVGLYLLVPARVCGLNCPSCISADKHFTEETESALPACHQAQAPSCHQTEAQTNQCNSNSDKPHQCCLKSIPSLASDQKFIPASQEVKASKLEVASTFNSAEKLLEQSPTFKLALDSYHHKLKASHPL